MQPLPGFLSFLSSPDDDDDDALGNETNNEDIKNSEEAFFTLGAVRDSENNAMNAFPEEKICSLGYGASRTCRVVIRAEELCLEVRMTPNCDFPCSTDFCATSLLEMQTECKVAVCEEAAVLPPLTFQYTMFGMSLVVWCISAAVGFVYGGRWLARMPMFGQLSQSVARLRRLTTWCLCCCCYCRRGLCGLIARRFNGGRGDGGAAAAQGGAEDHERDIERGYASGGGGGGGDGDNVAFGGSRLRLVGDDDENQQQQQGEDDDGGAGAFLSDHQGPIMKNKKKKPEEKEGK